MYQNFEYVIQEGDLATKGKLDSLSLLVFFVARGRLSCVIPSVNNMSFISLTAGDHFGH